MIQYFLSAAILDGTPILGALGSSLLGVVLGPLIFVLPSLVTALIISGIKKKNMNAKAM